MNFWKNFKHMITGEIELIDLGDQDICRCGSILPKVKDNETPFEFCSLKCKYYFQDLD